MPKELKYGDQVYIQFSSNEIFHTDKNCLLCSNAFFDDSLAAVQAHDYTETSFVNCIFTILPCLIDTRDEVELLDNLQDELDLMPSELNESEQTSHLGYSTLKKNILIKRNILKTDEKSLIFVNKKIICESIGKSIRFGESVIFQHMISGTYLCAFQNPHPKDRNLLNLVLSKETRQDCYFRIMNLYDNARDGVEYETDLRIVSLKYGTQIAMGESLIDMSTFRHHLGLKITESRSDIDEDSHSSQSKNPEEMPIFPIDLNSKKTAIETFHGDKFSIGMQFENEHPIPIRFIEYCSRFDLEKYNRNKTIRNATFIRLSSIHGYLTGNNNLLSLDSYMNEEYNLNHINTIFQLIKCNNQNDQNLPQGIEIYSNSKKAQDLGETTKYYLRHYRTGYEVCNNMGELYVKNEETDGLNIPPLIELISFNQDEEYQPINKNNSVAIKILFEGKLNMSYNRFLMDKDYIPQNHNQSPDIVNDYYMGYNDTDQIINNKIKIIQKNLEFSTNNGLQFKLIPIPENEMIQIMEIDSYVTYLKKYLTLIQNTKINQEIQLNEFNSMTKNINDMTNGFLLFFKHYEDHRSSSSSSSHPLINPRNEVTDLYITYTTSNTFKQIISRELKVIDLFSMIIYYSLVDEWLSKFLIDDKPKDTIYSDEIFNEDVMIKGFIRSDSPINHGAYQIQETIEYDEFHHMSYSIIRSLITIIKDNRVNKQYCNQFLKIYLNAFLCPRGVLTKIDDKLKQDIRQILMELIMEILENSGAYCLNQLDNFESRFFYLLEINNNRFDQINLSFLNFIFRIKSPIIQLSMVRNFIDKYLDNEEKKQLILPSFQSRNRKFVVKLNESLSNDSINSNKDDQEDKQIMYAILKCNDNSIFEADLTEENPKARYIIGIFELLNSLVVQDSLKFSQIIIKYYPVYSCLQILDNHKLLPQLKDEISKLLKNVHYSYTQLPIRKIPNEIQLIFINYEKYIDFSQNMIKLAGQGLISNAEKNLLKQRKLDYLLCDDNESTTTMTNDILNSKKKKGLLNTKNLIIKLDEDFESQSYKIHLMENTLLDTNILDLDNLIMIHNNTVKLLKMIANAPDDLTSIKGDHIFMDNAENIFSIIELVDDHVIRLSLMHTFDSICKKLVNNSSNTMTTPRKQNPSPFEKLLSSYKEPQAMIKMLEEEILQRLSEAFDDDWRNKKRLYSLENQLLILNDHNTPCEVYLEDEITSNLWKLIEKKNIKLASLAVKALQRKAKYESRVLNELNRWTIISNSQEAENMITILEALLKCHQISRRLKIIYEFNLDKIDNKQEGTSKIILESLENIITSIYDYNRHIGKTIENNIESKILFLTRLRDSKKSFNEEKPFIIREKYINIELQKSLSNFKIHDILIPLIPEFFYSQNFIESDPEFILIFRYIIIILMIFVKDNSYNQNLLANHKNIDILLFDNKLIECNTDSITLFYELCHENKKLLKLELPHIHHIIQKYFLQEKNLLELVYENEPHTTSKGAPFTNPKHKVLYKGDSIKHPKLKKSGQIVRPNPIEIEENFTPRGCHIPHLPTPTNPNSRILDHSDPTVTRKVSTDIQLDKSSNMEEQLSQNPFFLSTNLNHKRKTKDIKPKTILISKHASYKNINKIRTIPLIFSTNLPKGLFDVDNMMMNNLYYLDEFLIAGDWFSLPLILSYRPILSIDLQEKANLFKTMKKENSTIEKESAGESWMRYEFPVPYLLVKETIKVLLMYAESNNKNRTIFIQSKRQTKDFCNYLTNKNIEFNFDIKSLLLSFMQSLFYKKYKKPKVFEKSEDFDNFISILFMDIIGYIAYQSDDNLEFIGNDCFLMNYPWIKSKIINYYKLFKIHPNKELNKITFLEYQMDVYFLDSWKKYIFHYVMELFVSILTYDSEFMLAHKEKQPKGQIKFQRYFDVWVFLIQKLAEIEKDEKYIASLFKMVKKVAVINDFSDLKEILASFKNQVQSNYKRPEVVDTKIKTYSFLFSNIVTNIFAKFDLRDLLQKHIKLFKSSQNYREKNLRTLAYSISESEVSIKRLVKFIDQESKETCVKNIIFVLRLLRKIIQIQNPREIDSNKPIYEWDDLSSSEFKKIVITQDKLKKFDIVKALYNLFLNFSHNQKIIKETLELSISLLYGGNKDIQDLYYQEFINDNDNELIQYLATLIDHIFTNIFSSETIRNRTLYFKAQNFVYEYFELKNNIKNINTGYKEELANEFYHSLVNQSQDDNIRDNNDYILPIIILKFMQCLCENHHLGFQEFLTNQIYDGKIHPQTFNFTAYFRTTYQRCIKVLNIYNIDMVIKLVDFLIEILQGESKEITNLMLRKTLITDLCQTLTCYDNDLDLLPRGFSFDKHHKKLQQLKTKCIILLKTLLEKSDSLSIINIDKCYDINRIISFMISCFQKYIHEKNDLPNNINVDITEYFHKPYLMDGINCYIVLKYIWQGEDFNQKMSEILEKLDFVSQHKIQMDYMIFIFCAKYVGSIEILKKKTNQISRIYFPIFIVFDYLTPEMKLNFTENVDRSNTQTKVEEFMEAIESMITQISQEYNSRNRFLGFNMADMYKLLRVSTNVIAVLANLVNLITLSYFNDDGSQIEFVTQEIIPAKIVTFLTIFNMILSMILFILWRYSKMNKILKLAWTKYVEKNVKQLGVLPPMTESYLISDCENILPPKEISDIILKLVEPYSDQWQIARSQSTLFYFLKSWQFLLCCGPFLWNLLYVCICIGSVFHPIICAFQLWDIVVRSDTVNRLAMAMSNNARQFFWTTILLFTTVYIYSLIGLFYLNEEFSEDGTRLCADEYSCFLVNLNYGLRSGGGIAEVLSKPLYDSDNRGIYLLRVIFDLSFFIVVIILMMNLIFGMIIDSFGELRDEKNKNEEDMKNVCFICGISRSEIERYFDFKDHIHNEHNMWYYLAYLIYIQAKNKAAPTELTDIESYVLDRYSKKDHAWLPIGRSLNLEQIFEQGEKQKKTEIELLKEEISVIFGTLMQENKTLSDELKEMKGMLSKNMSSKKSITQMNSVSNVNSTRSKHFRRLRLPSL